MTLSTIASTGFPALVIYGRQSHLVDCNLRRKYTKAGVGDCVRCAYVYVNEELESTTGKLFNRAFIWNFEDLSLTDARLLDRNRISQSTSSSS